MKKEATPKMQKGSFKRSSMKKEATLKNTRDLFKRPPMKKDATLKKRKGAHSKDLQQKKRQPQQV
jgi:hypothetical protein